MSGYYLGIDYGTGGAKACITNSDFNVVSYAFREYPIIVEHPGWSEHDPHLYWQYCCEMIKECITKASINPKDIKGIGTSSALPSMVMVDRNQNPIQRAYNLMDRRATKEVLWLKEIIGEKKIFEITGNRLEDHPSIVNLLWEKTNRPDSFKKIDKVLTMDGYIRMKLTGKITMTLSAGPFYGVAYNIYTNEFDNSILSKIDINPDIIPPVYECEKIIGNVTESAAKETGLASGIPVAAGQVDCNAGWIGGGATEVGDIQMNLGTCGNFGIIHQDPDFLDSMINFAYTIDSRHTYITVPTTTTGGQLIRYMRDNFSHVEMAMEKINGIDAYDLLNIGAEKIKPGSEGLIVLPFLMGERTPIWDVDARGVIFGLSLNHTKSHLVRAMMESVAYALYDSFRLLKEKVKIINFPIVLNEGGAKSKLWRKIITDVFNIPTVLVKNRVGAPYGDALLAAVSVGALKDYSIAKQKAEYIDLMEPDTTNHALYMEYFALYKDLYDHIKGDYKSLTRLRKNWEC
jgi:xylulokinase